jgi:hypothetical protein
MRFEQYEEKPPSGGSKIDMPFTQATLPASLHAGKTLLILLRKRRISRALHNLICQLAYWNIKMQHVS